MFEFGLKLKFRIGFFCRRQKRFSDLVLRPFLGMLEKESWIAFLVKVKNICVMLIGLVVRCCLKCFLGLLETLFLGFDLAFLLVLLFDSLPFP